MLGRHAGVLVRRVGIVVGAVLGVLVVTPLAAAADPSVSGYAGTAGSVQSDVDGSGGALPFTGLDLGLLVAGGLALLALGFALRRIARG